MRMGKTKQPNCLKGNLLTLTYFVGDEVLRKKTNFVYDTKTKESFTDPLIIIHGSLFGNHRAILYVLWVTERP